MKRHWVAEKRYGRWNVEEYWPAIDAEEIHPRSRPILVGEEQHLAIEIADALNEAYKAGARDTPKFYYHTTFNYKPQEHPTCPVKLCTEVVLYPNLMCEIHATKEPELSQDT